MFRIIKGRGRVRSDNKVSKTHKGSDNSKVRKESQKGMIKRVEKVSELPERSRATNSMKSEVPLKMKRETVRECRITPDKVANSSKRK